MKRIEEIDEKKYEEFLHNIDHGLVYHKLTYLKLISKLTESDCYLFFGSSDKNEIMITMAVCVKASQYGKIGNSLPFFGSNGGVIAAKNSEKYFHQFLSYCLDKLRELNLSGLTIITHPFEKDFEKYLVGNLLSIADYRISLVNYLPEEENDLMQNFEDPRPRNIRKAQRSGVLIRKNSNLYGLDNLRAIHIKNMNSISGKSKPDRFFEYLPIILDNKDWEIYEAVLENKVISSLLLLFGNQTVEYCIPVIDEEFRPLQPLSLIVYEAMKDSIKLGFRYWNWGGTWSQQDGVAAFKRKWGPKESKYFYLQIWFKPEFQDNNLDEVLSSYPFFYLFKSRNEMN